MGEKTQDKQCPSEDHSLVYIRFTYKLSFKRFYSEMKQETRNKKKNREALILCGLLIITISLFHTVLLQRRWDPNVAMCLQITSFL